MGWLSVLRLSANVRKFSKDVLILANLSHPDLANFSRLPSKNTGETLLALPIGFEYNVIGKSDSQMSDGNKTPKKHDGMATFEVGGELRIVRNHEVVNGRLPVANSAIGANPYDEAAGGGTTTLVIDRENREIIKDFVSLSGTLVNCAGGATPWGSWISCEETTIGKTVITDKNGTINWADLANLMDIVLKFLLRQIVRITPIPLKAMGRFVHEAITVDKNTGVVYLTEDSMAAGFYRFLSNRNQHLAEGGKLQMLKIKDKDAYDTRNGQTMGMSFAANWVTIDKPDPEEADVDDLAVYKQGLGKGAATFSRLEGCWADENGKIYFASTSGGNMLAGQIWLYEPVDNDEGKLTLVFESPSRDLLDMPDNICLRPNSDLIFMCEDSDYSLDDGVAENYLRILTPEGKIADFAKNIVPKFEATEFAGSVFSLDGKTLFVNLQAIGATLAIWGNWESFTK